MQAKSVAQTVCTILLLGLAGCGGGGSDTPAASSGSGTTTPIAQNGTVSMLVSDDSSDDWATIGVKVLSIALTPQGGGAPVTVYTAPSPAPMVNLEELDQLAEILGNVSVPAGTYTSATLTLGGNPNDVSLTVSPDPESGFAGAAGSTIASNQIQIQGGQGSAPSRTVSVNVSFVSPLVVTAGQNNALDLEFNLDHPAFIVGHTPPSAAGATLWAVNFRGPIRHRPIHEIRRLVLRHTYGTVNSVATDNSSITITKNFPTVPVVSPETAVSSGLTLQILADSTNGTLFYDLDAKTRTTLKDFSSVAASLANKYVRVAARYQENGTLVGVRIWASSNFNSVWISPEGHVTHVNAANTKMWVTNEQGASVPIAVDANTQFFFRTPENAQADATPIGTGTGFLAANNLVRGFKVHVSVVDPLATPMVAQSVDIENAAYSGRISAANTTGFTYTHNFATVADNYTVGLDYISSSTANGTDSTGNAITGFKWWDFAFPTLVTSGTNAVANYISATNGGVNFGGPAGAVVPWGVSSAVWNDPANPTGWSAKWTILMPAPVPLGNVATGLSNNAFTMTVVGGAQAATVDVTTTSGSATLVYQVDRSNGVVTVSPIDITTSAGLTSLTNGLAVGAAVKVYGTPQADGTLKAYVLTYFTGDQPAS
ncbi:MAG TPA: DUF4382 domain-containing protein [Steroidobacteraceae bacterium]|jgi:hypothetical protein